jgi:hypothetical protein
MRPFKRVTLALSTLAVGACSGTKDAKPASGAVATAIASPANRTVTAPDTSYDVQLPARWTGSYRVDSLSSAERGTARPGAFNIVYLPVDTTVLPQTLIVVAVYDSVAWAKLKTQGGPPPGDSIMAKNGRVYILGLPQSNPFSPGTVDALKFDSLTLNPVERGVLIHVRN